MSTKASHSKSKEGRSGKDGAEEQSPGKHSKEAQSPRSPGKFDRLKSFLTRSPDKKVKSPSKEEKSAKKEVKRPSKMDKSVQKLSKSPKKEEKRSKVKKPTKTKDDVHDKKQRKEKETVDQDEKPGETSKESKSAEKNRSMVQTSLVNTTEGIEVFSSPEQPQAKVQKQKSGKKSRSSHSSKKQNEEKKQQTRISDIFPLRKSGRVCKSEQEKKDLARITEAILSKKNEGLEVRDIEGKGRGVFATRLFGKDEFVCEYDGELINFDEAKKREQYYSKNEDIGCYMYYIQFNNKKYCIDATEENDTFGRLLNHSRTGGNCKTKLHVINNKPHLILVTTREVKTDEELTYDYGDRSKSAIDSHPWLKY